MTVVIIQNNLNSLHVREVAKALNHDSVDWRDAFAAIQLVHKNNCAARLHSYKKDLQCELGFSCLVTFLYHCIIVDVHGDSFPIFTKDFKKVCLEPLPTTHPSQLRTFFEYLIFGFGNLVPSLELSSL